MKTLIHMTTVDKIELYVTLISLADCIWFAGDMVVGHMNWYHYPVAVLLTIGLVGSSVNLYKLLKRHHKQGCDRTARKQRESSYTPVLKHSEK